MPSLSDQIEEYFRQLLKRYQGEIEIKRNKLADEFDCAPSQINYVLDTRFTVEKGYVVESQRGGGGYIRIIKVKINSATEVLQNIITQLDDQISQREAEGIIERLYENNVISKRERYLMGVAIHRKVIGVDLPYRDYIRARIFKGMLEVIFKYKNEGG